MKRRTCLLAGITALLAAVGFCFVSAEYLFDGAGSQMTGFGVSTNSVVLGWVHLTGFLLAAGISFMLGVWWCSDGLVPDESKQNPESDARNRRQEER